jgi:hypothetical protein
MKCLRIYADANGESHFEDIDIPVVPMELFPGGSSNPSVGLGNGDLCAVWVGAYRTEDRRLAHDPRPPIRHMVDRMCGV